MMGSPRTMAMTCWMADGFGHGPFILCLADADAGPGGDETWWDEDGADAGAASLMPVDIG